MNSTAAWIGSALTPGVGSYGGGVFGCDGRVYALPHFDETRMMRITPEADGGFTFDELPLSNSGPHRLSGGVIARPCGSGFRIIAAGRGGLFALDPTEGAVAVTALTTAAATGRTFVGVARLGDDRVVSAPAETVNDFLSLWVDSNTLTVASTVGNNNLSRRFGLASVRTGGAFVMTESGTVSQQHADGGTGALRTVAGQRLRWPTNSLTGWVFASGEELIAWNEGVPPPNDSVLFSPAANDASGFTSGGLVLTTSGALVSVPGKTGRSVITIYTPAAGATRPGSGLVLSPWFNKL